MRFLRLKLQGPLQSWGERSRWDSRDTASMPTKSGVIGLIGCCLGYPRGDERIRALSSSLHIAVRADRAGVIMTDFHTVQTESGGFPNAEGGRRSSNNNTIITPKQYLQDADFTVWIWGKEESLQLCADALKKPVWTPYLGRKSCVPATPILPEWLEAESVDDAIRQDSQHHSEIQIELLPGEPLKQGERLIQRPDELTDAHRNEYRYRMVRAFSIGGEGS